MFDITKLSIPKNLKNVCVYIRNHFAAHQKLTHYISTLLQFFLIKKLFQLLTLGGSKFK